MNIDIETVLRLMMCNEDVEITMPDDHTYNEVKLAFQLVGIEIKPGYRRRIKVVGSKTREDRQRQIKDYLTLKSQIAQIISTPHRNDDFIDSLTRGILYGSRSTLPKSIIDPTWKVDPYQKAQKTNSSKGQYKRTSGSDGAD